MMLRRRGRLPQRDLGRAEAASRREGAADDGDRDEPQAEPAVELATRSYFSSSRLARLMSANKKIVEAHMAATDKRDLAKLLADDVEWVEWADGVPREGVLHKGRSAFVENYGTDELTGEIVRMIEEGNVVVVEGIAHVKKKGGKKFDVRYIDLFELLNGKIQRKSSYGALLKSDA